jgi:hypothetical protein
VLTGWCQVFETVAAITTVRCVEVRRSVSSFGKFGKFAAFREGTSTGVERVSSTVLAAASRAERCAVNAVDPAPKQMHSNGVSTQLLGSAGIMYALSACIQLTFSNNLWIESNMSSCRESFAGVASRLVMSASSAAFYFMQKKRSSLPSTASDKYI